jgi:23S rRNA pseudouridine1911/1915/1917 synthase
MEILYEDNHCIAVVKPPGMPVQGDESGDRSLMDEVKAYVKEKYAKPGEVFLGLVHRLDRPVGGVVLFAKTSKGAARLSEQFSSHRVRKVYLAITEGIPEDASGEVKQWIRKDEERNRSEAADREEPGSKYAELSYRVLSSGGGRALVEVTPKTGRPHQIRLAMASLHTPIVGDLKYGASHGLGNRIELWARSLTFFRPVGGDEVTVTADPGWRPLR